MSHQSTSERTRRLYRELAESQSANDFILIQRLCPIDSDLKTWVALIRGPVGTPYEGILI